MTRCYRRITDSSIHRERAGLLSMTAIWWRYLISGQISPNSMITVRLGKGSVDTRSNLEALGYILKAGVMEGTCPEAMRVTQRRNIPAGRGKMGQL